jgi:hypothetical protein
MKPTEGRMVCTYCGAVNPDSEEVCPDTGARHHLISSSDKQELGMGYGKGPGFQQGTTDPRGAGIAEDKKKLHQHSGHGFAQTDTVKHCPFCGSGDVWGGSDGTITCEFDGATFQVSVEPQYPSAPGNINGQDLNIDGEPDEFGQADAGDAYAVPDNLDPSAGEDLDMDGGGGEEDEEGGQGGGPPWLNQGDDDDEDEDDEDEGRPGNLPPRQSSYRTHMGDTLSEELYLKHLAIRHAEEPRRFLASLRASR